MNIISPVILPQNYNKIDKYSNCSDKFGVTSDRSIYRNNSDSVSFTSVRKKSDGKMKKATVGLLAGILGYIGVYSYCDKLYPEVSVRNKKTKEVYTVKMQRGVSFENNGAIFRMNEKGILTKYDKYSGDWVECDEILMTQYQWDVFRAVADNKGDKLTLSKRDIEDAIDMYSDGELTADLGDYTGLNGYNIRKTRSYSSNNAFSTYVTNGKSRQSAELVFKYGTQEDALIISDFVQSNEVDNNYVPKNNTKIKRTGNLKQPSKMSPSDNAYKIIKKYETLVLYTYDDLDKSNPKKFIKKGMKYKGTLTNGYGHTKGVKPGQTITKKQAEKYLRDDVDEAVKTVQESVKVPLKQNEFDALVSFVYNVGPGAFKCSTLLKCLNSGDFDGAAGQFGRFVYSKQRRLRGLVYRREKERKMFVGK